MNPLTNYAEVFNKNDSKLFAELFADDCIFYDTAPTCAGMDPMFVRGKEGVDMIFNMYFHSMPMSAKPVSLNGNVLDYIICYPGIEIPCCGELLEEKDGKLPGTMCVIAQSKHDNILLSRIERRILSKRAVSKVRRLNKHVK